MTAAMLASTIATHQELAATAPRRTALHQRRTRLAVRLAIALAIAAAIAGALALKNAADRRPVELHLTTIALDRAPIAATFSASGALSALVTVSVGSQVSGRIETLRADFGSNVHEGEVIATIESSFFRAAVAQASANHKAALAALARARAQADNSERQYARTLELSESRLIAQADYDAAELALLAARADVTAAAAGVAQAKAALDQTRLNLRYTTIVSPIDGVVISRNVDVGQTVAATLQAPTLFTIAQDLTRMQVHANVAEADIGKLRQDAQVTFTVDAYPERLFTGVVRQLRDNAQTLQNVVTYDAVIDVDNAERLLKPGMTANVTVVHARRADVLRVVNAALRFKPSHATLLAADVREIPALRAKTERVIWLQRAAKLVPVIATIGITDGVRTELIGGDVRPGERAVVEVGTPDGQAGP
jgi:HlyD family secretion protein